MFAPLPPLSLERLAASAVPMEFAPGTPIIREGEPGDHFYVIAVGEVEVTTRGRPVTTLGAGESFGEIALVRDVPRTATVVARTDVLTYGLTRETFLRALSRSPASLGAADRVISERTPGAS